MIGGRGCCGARAGLCRPTSGIGVGLTLTQLADLAAQSEEFGLKGVLRPPAGRGGVGIRARLRQGLVAGGQSRGEVGVFQLEPRVGTVLQQPAHADGGDADHSGGNRNAG